MKLVGTFMGVVTDAEVGENHNGKKILKITWDVQDELINGEFRPLDPPQKVVQQMSLDPVVKVGGKSDKSPAQWTSEKLKKSFGFTKKLDQIGDLIFMRRELVCVDNGTKFTNIEYVNDPATKSVLSQSAKLKEFDPDVMDDINRFFGE
jgi:hypothetical protein